MAKTPQRGTRHKLTSPKKKPKQAKPKRKKVEQPKRTVEKRKVTKEQIYKLLDKASQLKSKPKSSPKRGQT